MNQRLGPLVPELVLAASAVAGLLLGSWLPRHRQWLVGLLAAAGLAGAAVATGFGLTAAPAVDFGTSYSVDVATNAVRLAVLVATLLVLGLSVEWVRGRQRETEYWVLLLLTALGTIILAGANDLLLLFAGFLLASVPGYALAGFGKDSLGTEAALKYYLIGALLGVLTLTGITLLYGVSRTTSYPQLAAALPGAPRAAVAVGLVAVLSGLLFKVGAVPAHFWVPDVTEGAAAPVAAFLTTVPKLGGLVALYRLVAVALPGAPVSWPLLLALLAAAAMTLGNLGAFFQTSAKRLLAYSTISQVGYLLMAVAVAGRSSLALPALLGYLTAYAVTNLAAFAVVCELPRAGELADYRGLARRHPGLAGVLLVALLGLVGTPPTAVFLGKLEVFSAAVDGGYAWLAALAVANTVASLFYYLRWLAPAFLGTPDPEPAALVPAGSWAGRTAYLAGVASLALGIGGGLVLPLLSGPLAVR